MAAVAAADSPRLIVVDIPDATQFLCQLVGGPGEFRFLRQGQNGGFHGRQARIKFENHALIDTALGVRGFILNVGIDEEGHHGAGQAEGRLDDVGYVAFAAGLIKVFELRVRVLIVHAQVVVGAVCHTHEFAPFAALETKTVLNVDGARRVVRTVVLRNIELAHVLGVNAQVNEPVPAVFNPCVKVLICFVGVNEVFDLHLLEFAGAEDEVAGGDLVTERLTDLPDTEGRTFTGRSHHIVEVYEDTLRSFGAQKVQPFLVIDRTQVGFQQA